MGRQKYDILHNMIAQITGIVAHKTSGMLVVVSGGIGYAVHTPQYISQKSPLQKEITLLTHLAVREDSMDLYGFTEREELVLFEKLITVSGIGPKSALAILNLAPVSKLTYAISTGDASYLTSVSGIGKKSAAKIILELKDTVWGSAESASDQDLRGEKDALLALVSLGYGAEESREALRNIKNKSADTGKTVKEALQLLGQ